MTNVTKIISIVSAFGVIGGGAGLAYHLLSNGSTKLQNKLSEEGFELLNVDLEGGNWTAILTDYRTATKNIFGNAREEQKPEKDLRENCREILNKKVFKESDYLLARQWCVKKVKATEILEKNYKILNSKENIQTDKDLWSKRVELLKGAPDKFSELKNKMKQLETAKEENITLLKAECEKLKTPEIFTTNEKFGDVFEQLRDYCSVKKNVNN